MKANDLRVRVRDEEEKAIISIHQPAHACTHKDTQSNALDNVLGCLEYVALVCHLLAHGPMLHKEEDVQRRECHQPKHQQAHSRQQHCASEQE